MAFEKFKEMGNLVKQAREMKSKMQEVQDQLRKIQLEAKSVFTVAVVSGEMDLLDLRIDPGAVQVDPATLEKIQKDAIRAINAALKQAKDRAAAELSAVTGGFKIPGIS